MSLISTPVAVDVTANVVPVVVDLTVSAPTIVVDILTVSGPRGLPGAALVISVDAPPDPTDGMMWLKSDTWVQYTWYVDADSAQWVQTNGGGGGGGGSSSLDGLTVDTGEPYRLIMLSSGSVFAIPAAAVPPVAPTGLAATVRYTSVALNWTAAVGATSYVIQRDGVQIGTTTSPTYRDRTTVAGSTYSYTVASVDTYKQRSPASAPVIAFVDPALNVPPAGVVISCWPLPIPTDGPVFIRVNAIEPDMQKIAYTLGIDAGSLTTTQDPSVWVFRI